MKRKSMRRQSGELIPPKSVVNPSKMTSHSEVDYIEGVVCKESDIQENEMKTFDLGEGKILLIKQNGVLSAIGNKCTHYGAPLINGALGDGRVRCPWHGACFNTKTGDIEDFPGLDSVPCYEVTLENGDVHVRGKLSDLKTSKRTKPFASKCASVDNTYVVIGGGPSAAICAETIRQSGFTGTIKMICREKYLPYDRIKLSKQLDADVEKLQFRTPAFYKDGNIDVLTNVEATALNSKDKVVSLSNGDKINYTKCFIATGSDARKPTIEGSNLKNIYTLREYDDTSKIRTLIKPENEVVILGSSFIGLEAAAYCVGKVAKVTVIGQTSVPLEKVFGQPIGARLKELFEEKGVNFVMKSGIKKFIGSDGALTSVELNDGSVLKADVCIAGIGSTFNTNFLKDSGIEIRSDGSIPVNSFMETNVPGVYAGGDIAYAPIYSNNNEPAAIGHIGLASYHGKIAALNMVGKTTESKSVPFFWTMIFGKSVRYSGYGQHDDLKVEGDLKELKFVCFYFKGDKVIGIASCNRDPIVAKFAELSSQGKHLNKNDILKDPFGWSN
ncbi:apoptosis-inducing factor 3 isoform X2 [Chrysoperla carnea]|uniref:apoptosis-inducing factor 3 isoform X2 n=1 Tax=Chrysoperla carnea TaxID=189513 RepID=UPI001D081CED|nr:apoptosis-inducing factor 3 isoform X2 [Chrysoperla carnea]